MSLMPRATKMKQPSVSTIGALTDERLRHAEIRLDEFIDTAERGRNDLVIGHNAQGALEHGMKALLEAHGAPYRRTHGHQRVAGQHTQLRS